MRKSVTCGKVDVSRSCDVRKAVNVSNLIRVFRETEFCDGSQAHLLWDEWEGRSAEGSPTCVSAGYRNMRSTAERGLALNVKQAFGLLYNKKPLGTKRFRVVFLYTEDWIRFQFGMRATEAPPSFLAEPRFSNRGRDRQCVVLFCLLEPFP